MNDLPNEILTLAVGYLPPWDAIQLNNTCKKLHSKLSLTARAPRTIITEFSRRNRDSDVHYGFRIPVPNQVSCHSMNVSMIWKDQGWGNRKGKLFVVAEEKNQPYDKSSQRFGGGRRLYTSEIAPHEEHTLGITFQPKENETYHIWYVVGGGGGHSLSLFSVIIQALLFDDIFRCYGKACNFLTRTEALPAWDEESSANIRLHIEQFVLTQGEHLLPPLISFADRRNVSDNELQRKLMGFIQSICESWMEEHSAYAKTTTEAGPSQQGFGQLFRRLDTMQVDDFLEDRMDFGEYIVGEEDF